MFIEEGMELVELNPFRQALFGLTWGKWFVNRAAQKAYRCGRVCCKPFHYI